MPLNFETRSFLKMESSQTWPAGLTTSSTAATFAQPAAIPLTAAQKLLLPLGVVVFDWLFWRECGGVNMLVFTILIVAAQLLRLPRYAAARRSRYCWLLVGGSLFSGAMMAVYGSNVAALACVVSVLLLLGYINQPHLKLVLYALLTGFSSVVQAGPRVLLGLRAPRNSSAGLRRGGFYGRLLLLPLAVLGAFHLLFAVANPRYQALSSRVLETLGDFLALLLPEVSLPHVVFLILGFLVVAGAVVLVPVHLYADYESGFGEFIERQRDRVASFAVRQPNFRLNTARALDLRKEFVAAAAVFALVNLLLLVVNLIDIKWLWFGFVPQPGFDLTQFVHEGTYVLIFSILLAMGIVLWFFPSQPQFLRAGAAVAARGRHGVGAAKRRTGGFGGAAQLLLHPALRLGLQAHWGVLFLAAGILRAGHGAAQNMAAALGLRPGAAQLAGHLRGAAAASGRQLGSVDCPIQPPAPLSQHRHRLSTEHARPGAAHAGGPARRSQPGASPHHRGPLRLGCNRLRGRGASPARCRREGVAAELPGPSQLAGPALGRLAGLSKAAENQAAAVSPSSETFAA
jgi:hypothetical protein